MARGWESKSVESQIELAEIRIRPAPPVRLSPEELARQHQRESLELSRTRVLHDIEAATHPRYREILEAALLHLEKQIAVLEEPATD